MSVYGIYIISVCTIEICVRYYSEVIRKQYLQQQMKINSVKVKGDYNQKVLRLYPNLIGINMQFA